MKDRFGTGSENRAVPIRYFLGQRLSTYLVPEDNFNASRVAIAFGFSSNMIEHTCTSSQNDFFENAFFRLFFLARGGVQTRGAWEWCVARVFSLSGCPFLSSFFFFTNLTLFFLVSCTSGLVSVDSVNVARFLLHLLLLFFSYCFFLLLCVAVERVHELGE